jgi:hypothetical protein
MIVRAVGRVTSAPGWISITAIAKSVRDIERIRTIDIGMLLR